MKEGTLRVSKKLGGKIKSDGKEYSVPKEFTFSDRESFDKKTCQFELGEDDKGNARIIRIVVDGKDVPKDAGIEKQKEEAKAKKAAAAEAEKQDREAKRKAQRQVQQNPQKRQVDVRDTFSIRDTCLPYDVTASRIRDVDNFYLKFHKYARYGEFDRKNGEKDFRFFFEKSEGKRKVTHRLQFDFHQQKDLIEQVCKDQYQSAAKLHGEDHLANADFKVDWRLVVGLGGASVYETSMTLHHLYGFPYIPASGIKGMVNAYVHTQVADNDKNDDDIKRIFGTQEQAGNIIFYDALPKTPPTIKPDVMNPHYTPYYQPKNKTEYPADYHKPVPVNFLTVVDTTFSFVIGIRNNVPPETDKKQLLKKTKEWLKSALEEQGIGAKTAVGYGYMS